MKYSVITKNEKLLIYGAIGCVLLITIIISSLLIIRTNNKDVHLSSVDVNIPEAWNDDEYVRDFELTDYVPVTDYNTLSESEFIYGTIDTTSLVTTYSTELPKLNSMTKEDVAIICLPEDNAWSYISNGYFKTYPTGSFNSNKSILQKIQNENTEIINVNVWYWEDPSDPTNLSKVTAQRKFAVNSAIASLFVHAFEDIYNHPDKPVINLADRGMGTWVLRGKNHNNNASLSTHSLGCCIDINPSTGNAKINGKWYGNGYGMDVMSKAMWETLPDTHIKYHILYDGSPIVDIFKSYGFVWGGDWSGTKDPMHLSFIGEGKTCRAQGKQNYLNNASTY